MPILRGCACQVPPSWSTSCDFTYVIVGIDHRDTAIDEFWEVPPTGPAPNRSAGGHIADDSDFSAGAEHRDISKRRGAGRVDTELLERPSDNRSAAPPRSVADLDSNGATVREGGCVDAL